MSIVIKNSNDLTSPWTHWFLLGDTGSGKTSAIATFPYPFIIVPKNEQSILRLVGLGIDYVEVETPDEMAQALSWLEGAHSKSAQYLRQAESATDEAVREELYAAAWAAFPYQTVGVESLSHYTDLVIEAITGVKDGWQTGKMDQQKWGQLSAHLRNLQVRLRNLPVHAVFTALATLKENENTKVVLGGPLMSGAMAFKLPSACDAIGYCEEMPSGVRRIHFKKYKMFPGRARVPIGVEFPAVIEDFSWEKVKHFFGH